MGKTICVFETDLTHDVKLKKVEDLEFVADKPDPDGREDRLLNVYDDVKYQEILGFGGAFTEATAVNICDMPKELHKQVIDLYFHREKGIGYSFCRSTINSCDFSEDFYSYDDVKDDFELKHFDISHDKNKIIPVIKEAMDVAEEFKLYSSPWSPPAWMKTNAKMSKGGKLKEECYDVWARYVVKFIEEYAKEGIDVWGVTIQNEAKAEQGWESCFYAAQDERVYADDFLKPALIKAGLGEKKVFCWDHNKERAVDRAREIIGKSKNASNVDGLAVHWYAGDHFKALDAVHTLYPDKYIIASEQCTGKSKLVYQSGEKYAHDIIGDVNNYANAWVDWNMVLDENGCPDHWKDEQKATGWSEDKIWVGEAPIVYDKDNQKLDIRSSYYYMGHFSKFVRPGAKRIASTVYDESVETCAFINPDGTIVCVVLNRSDEEKKFALRYNTELADTAMKPHTIKTFIW